MYKIEVDSVKKAVKIVVSGMLSQDEAKNYLEELSDTCSKINTNNYALIIDAREQKAVSQDTIPYMEKAMKFYIDTPFKKRITVVLESAIAMSQVNRVGKKELEEFEMAKSIEEAYSKL